VTATARRPSPDRGDDRRPEAWLVRHGETEWSRSGRHTGRSDVELTDLGRAQARQLGARLADQPFVRILSSPMRRALDTARLAGFEARLEVDVDLCEWNYGSYEGITTPQIRETVPGWTVWTHAIPGGETRAEIANRVDRVVGRIRGSDGDVAIFAHGHVLRVLAARWLGLEAADGRLLALHTATISVLGWERETPVLERWNETCLE
jgi:broad specificity phosphatase PhoE